MTQSNFWASRLNKWIHIWIKNKYQYNLDFCWACMFFGILGPWPEVCVFWIVEFWNEPFFRVIRCRRSFSKILKLLGFWLLWWRPSQWLASRLLSTNWTNTIGFAFSTSLSVSWVLSSPWSHWWRPRDCFCPSTSCIPGMSCRVWSCWMNGIGVQWMHTIGSTEACSFF